MKNNNTQIKHKSTTRQAQAFVWGYLSMQNFACVKLSVS